MDGDGTGRDEDWKRLMASAIEEERHADVEAERPHPASVAHLDIDEGGWLP